MLDLVFVFFQALTERDNAGLDSLSQERLLIFVENPKIF